MTHSRRLRRAAGRLFTLYIPLGAFLVWALFPLYWMIVTSLKPRSELASLEHLLIVKAPTLEHFQSLLFNSDFPRWFLNNVIVAFAATALALVISTLAGYAIARLRFPGRWVISRGVLFSYLIPRNLLLIPLFVVVLRLGLIDSLAGLVLVYLTFMVPFCTWLLAGYFASVPVDIEESAMLDGCSRLQILVRILLPLAKPGLITATVFSFTLAWSEYLYPLVLTSSSATQVVPVGVSLLMTGDLFDWGRIMAAGVVFTLPILFLYYPLQRFLTGGLTAGAVKG